MPKERVRLELTLRRLSARLNTARVSGNRDEWFRWYDGSAVTDEEVAELARATARVTDGADPAAEPRCLTTTPRDCTAPAFLRR